MEEEKEVFIRKKGFTRCASNAHDELHSFRSCLRWLCVDQSDAFRASLSWSLFFLLAVGVPILSHFVLLCPNCDEKHRRPFDSVVQVSLTSIASLSFLCLSGFVRRYGLRRFLFLDKLCGESEKVRQGYMEQLNRSFMLLSIFVFPCFAAESAYKIWWYASGGTRIPFLGNAYVSDAIACILELCSWLYRTSIFFLVCVLFRLICHLQLLRLQDFALFFQHESEVATVLKEHLRIRRQLRIISHRFRAFILLALVIVTASQFASLLITTKANSDVNIYRAGELALCSLGLMTGLLILLRSAAKITHKAQAIVCHAAMWHICATTDSFDRPDCETPIVNADHRIFPLGNASEDGDSDGDVIDEDDMDDTPIILSNAHTITFQKKAGIR